MNEHENKIGLFAIGLIIAGLIISGCSTTNSSTATIPEITPVVANESTHKLAAVCVGLTAVDPASYSGWAGDCPGCDMDVKRMYDLCSKQGFSSTKLYNSEATWINIKTAIVKSTKEFTKDDLLVVSFSGHGGQEKDLNGDETSGYDSTLCFWDGQVLDDKVMDFISTLPVMRIVIIADQCHSESNFRAYVRKVANKITFGKYGKLKGKRITKPSSYAGQIIEFSGCKEMSYSYGDNSGGVWTSALSETFKSSLSWFEWFNSAKAKMTANQEPVWCEYNVLETFKNGKVMQ